MDFSKEILNEALDKFHLNKSFSSTLNYSSIQKHKDLFYISLNDGSLCTILEVPLIDHSPMTINEVHKCFKSFKELLNFDSSFTPQFRYEYQNSKQRGYVFVKKKFLFNKRTLFFNQDRVKTVLESFEKSSIENFYNKIKNYASLNNCKFLNKENTLHTIAKIVNFEHKDIISKNTNISEVISQSSSVEETDHLIFNNNKIYTYSLKDFSSSNNTENYEIRLGAIIDLISKLNNEDVNYSITLNLEKIKKETRLSYLAGYKKFFLNKIHKITKNESLVRHYEEANFISTDMPQDSSYFEASFHLITDKSPTELNLIRHGINELGAQFILETINKRAVIESCNPFQFVPALRFFTNRSHVLREDQLALLLPFWGEYKGNSRTGIDFVNKAGNDIKMSFDSETAGVTVVLSHSGAGKSTLINKISKDKIERSNSSYVFKIDNKTSSKVSCEIDNRYQLFNISDSNIPNPLSGIFSAEKIVYGTRCLLQMIKTVDPGFELKAEYYTIVENALLNAVVNHLPNFKSKSREKYTKKINITINEILVEINAFVAQEDDKYEGMGDLLKEKLAYFSSSGLKKDYLSDQGFNWSKDARYFVFDFEKTDEKSPFLSLTTDILVNNITEKINEIKESDPEAHGYIIVEELGQFSNNSVMTSYFSEICETFRKKNFQLICTAPKYDIFFDTEIGKTAFATAENLIIGKLGKTHVADFVRKVKPESTNQTKEVISEQQNDGFNEATIQLIKSLDEDNTSFKNFLWIDMEGKNIGIFRNIATPKEIWENASGSKRNFQFLQKFMKDNKQTMKEAVSVLEKQFPAGV